VSMRSPAERNAILARSPIGTTYVYRGVTLTRAWGSHVNAETDRGFIGAFPSFAEARRYVDRACERARERADVDAGRRPAYARGYGRTMSAPGNPSRVLIVARIYRPVRAELAT
jgi:hypothetical protein